MVQKQTQGARIGFLDVAKAYAIVLVIWGHLIQQTNPGFWDNGVFSFIYSFHMPLFFLLSGMFLGKLFSLTFLQALKKRAVQLLLPAATISLLNLVVRCLLGSAYLSIGSIASAIVNMAWFCRTLFGCSIITYLAKKWFKTDVRACIGSILLVHLIPNIDFCAFKMFLPFLWSGYFLMKHKDWIFGNAAKILPVSLLLYIVLLCFWNTSYTFYRTDSTIWIVSLSAKKVMFLGHNLWVGLYRFAIGLSGSLSVILLIKLLCAKVGWLRSSFIAYIGCNTLGIYLLQTFGENYFFKFFSPVNELFTPPFGWVSYAILLPLCAVGIVLLLTLFIRLIRKSRYLSFFMLGDNKTLSWK